MSDPRRLPKSLHTITALVRVAAEWHQLVGQDLTNPRYAILAACSILGYPHGTTDPDGLIERATDALAKHWESA